MLSAHQRLAIRARLPEVGQVYVRDDRGGIGDLSLIRLVLGDGSAIVLYCWREDGNYRCRRTRLITDDHGDRVLIEAIPAEMRERLGAVFGELRFDPGAF